MTRLDVTAGLIHSLVEEVSPLVERLTGWSLDSAGLRLRVLTRDRGYEEIVMRRMEAVGAPIDESAPRKLFERFVEYVFEHNVVGAYEPSRGELMLVRENVDDSNLDGLRLVIAHELTHRAQHVRHPGLFERLDAVARELLAMAARDAGLRQIAEKAKDVQAIMTLLESHAVWVQQVLQRAHFPEAEIETHHGPTALLLRLFAGAKLGQYRNGIGQVAEAAAAGKVESLYAGLKTAVAPPGST